MFMIPHAIQAAGAFLGKRWLVVLRILAVVGCRVEVAAVRWVLAVGTVGVVGPGSLADIQGMGRIEVKGLAAAAGSLAGTHDTGTIEVWGLVGEHSV